MNGLMRVSLLRSCHPMQMTSFLSPSANCVLVTQVNTLFAASNLGIDHYLEQRKRVNDQFGPLKDKFFERMKETMEDRGNDRMVFTEDLKNTTYLIDNKPEQLDLLVEMIRKFANQKTDLRFGKFIFGPVIMRMLHAYRQPETALALIRDPTLPGFFDQLSSYVICMDLLYKCEKYQEMLDLYDEVINKSVFDSLYPRDMTTLAISAAFRIGDAAAYQKAKDIISKAKDVGAFISNRSICLFAMLANKHNEPEAAFECLTLLRSLPALARNVKIITLCRLKRTDEAFMVLKRYLTQTGDLRNRAQFHGEFAEDALKALTDAIAESNDQHLASEFEKTIKILRDAGHVSQRSLNDMLLEEMENRKTIREREGLNFDRPPSNRFNRFDQTDRFNQNDRFVQNRRFDYRNDRFDNRQPYDHGERPRSRFGNRQDSQYSDNSYDRSSAGGRYDERQQRAENFSGRRGISFAEDE